MPNKICETPQLFLAQLHPVAFHSSAMADAPKLGELPQHSAFAVPTISSTGGDSSAPEVGSSGSSTGDSLQNARNAVASSEVRPVWHSFVR